MCNRTNIEETRQKLWCDIVTTLVEILPFSERIIEADLHLKQFDERFGTKHNEVINKTINEYNKHLVKLLKIRHSGIEPILINSIDELKTLFRDNFYKDVSSLADLDKNKNYFASIVDNKEMLAVLELIENKKQLCLKECGNTKPFNKICLNCGSSLTNND